MKRILIIDDEPHVIRVLRLRLERAGYNVETSHNGEDALKRVLEYPPDVMITDVQMPRMDGRELCQRIEDEFPNRSFLILVLTSRTEIEHRHWSRMSSNTKFIEKPASATLLLATLSEYFNLPANVECSQ